MQHALYTAPKRLILAVYHVMQLNLSTFGNLIESLYQCIHYIFHCLSDPSVKQGHKKYKRKCLAQNRTN